MQVTDAECLIPASALPTGLTEASLQAYISPSLQAQLLQKMYFSTLLSKLNPFRFHCCTYKCQNTPSQQKCMYLTSEDEMMQLATLHLFYHHCFDLNC